MKTPQRARQAKELFASRGWTIGAVRGSRPQQRNAWRRMAQRTSASAQDRASDREAAPLRVGGRVRGQ
jgi:hypothetical protein